MPAVSSKNYVLTSAAAADLGLGADLAADAQAVTEKLRKKRVREAPNAAEELGLQ